MKNALAPDPRSINPVVISLFDESGNALRPWADAGFCCYALDILNDDRVEGLITYLQADLLDPFWHTWCISNRPFMVMGFPPCTDLAVSGAAHFAKKRKINPCFQDQAVALARTVETIGDACACPWFLENPVSVMSTIWRKPDHVFHPYHFGGYLPVNDIHPRWPDYIKPRDAYPKKTCIWAGGGWRMPKAIPVEITSGYSDQHKRLGGKSAKTKQIRSETPRGFAMANYLENSVNGC